MANNLYVLGEYFYEENYREMARLMMLKMAGTMAQSESPDYYSNWGRLYLQYQRPPYEVAIVGTKVAGRVNKVDFDLGDEVKAGAVLALTPDFTAFGGLEIGVIGTYDPDERERLGVDVEVRSFVPSFNIPEDPVTGSLNAGLAQWLIGAGALPSSYVASQGTCLGRAGRVYIDAVDEDIWVGGATTTMIQGSVGL